MHNRGIALLVGVFMLLAAGALAVLTLQVSGLSNFYGEDKGYTITADFSNITGLKVRSRVTCAGVSIGRVKSIDFNKTNYAARVTLWINSAVDNLPEDSKASILTSGFLGDNYIGITPGFSETSLKNQDHIPLEETTSGVVLEELISRFVAGEAMKDKESKKE